MAWEFHRAVAGTSGNSLISPHSISSALGMVSLGARGQSLAELRQALHYRQPMSVENAAYEMANRKMNQAAAQDGVELAISNALLVAKDTVIRDRYKAAVGSLYRAEILHTVDELGKWMSRATKEKIVSLPEKEMAPDEFLAVNAIYFKGKFETPFEIDATLKSAPFHLPNGMNVEIPLMNKKSRYSTASGAGFRRLRLPYKGGNFALEILLPDEGRSLAQAEQAMTPEAFATLLALPLKTDPIKVYLPRFQLARRYALAGSFPALGLKSLVTRGGADLSEIGGAPGTFRLSGANHLTQIEVDEVGTEAVAVTGIAAGGFGAAAPPAPEFRADRPFLFVLRTNETILFVGRVENPHPAAR